MSDSIELDWRTLFSINESPYFAMFRAGCIGIPIEDCINRCQELNIPLRQKDIRSWSDGHWDWQLRNQRSVLNPVLRPETERRIPILQMDLHEFERWPHGWTGSDKRWFPCTEDNLPMYKWGYSDDFIPTLHEREPAQALSPIGWVGQNMYAQPFIVLDIDGVDHGETDPQVIEFGNRYRNLTETWENPAKPGSFHLYLSTPYVIPIGHFGYAKLDLMGNQKNAAVYTKNKQSNGLPRATLTKEIWEDLKAYILNRKEQRDNAL